MRGTSPRRVYGWLGLSRVALDWGRRSEMIGSRVWEIEGIRDPKGQISFRIPGFGMSDETDGGRSS